MHTATGMRQLDHFIRVEGSGLRRTGYLLTGSGPVADELLRVALAGLGDQLVLDGREGDGRGRGPTGAGTGKGPDAPAERPVA